MQIYIYTHICKYTYTHTYANIHVTLCVHICTYLHRPARACTYLYYIHTLGCMHIPKHSCINIYQYAHKYTYIYI